MGEFQLTDAKNKVAIIGAGIVGVSTAIWLQRSGFDVILIDKSGPASGTSFGNGGVLASCSILPVATPGIVLKAPKMLLDPRQPLFLKWSYLPKLAPWLIPYLKSSKKDIVEQRAKVITNIIGDSLADHQALSNGTEASKWVVPTDYLFIYENRSQYEADEFAWATRKKYGFEWDTLEKEAFRSYDPIFSAKYNFAARCKDHGKISDPGQYVKDLAAHVEKKGGKLIISEVSDILSENNQVTGVRIANETIACDAVVVATGAWSSPLAKKLGINVPLESERGYHLELWEPNIVPRSPVMITSGKFVATPMEGRLRLAGIVEFGGLNLPPSKAPFNLLLNNIRSAIPELKWKKTTKWMGHRPSVVDSLPVIGEAPTVKNVFLGFGHDHVGLTGGPKTGWLISQLISGQKTNIDMTPFSPTRFQNR